MIRESYSLMIPKLILGIVVLLKRPPSLQIESNKGE